MTIATLNKLVIAVAATCVVVPGLAACGSSPPTSAGGTTGRTAAAVKPFELIDATIPELQAALAAGQVSSSDLVAMYQARIAAYDAEGPKLTAISVVNQNAAAEAKALDDERRANKVRGPLHGIPIVVKDNFETANLQTAVGSRALAGWLPKRDAFLVARLKQAGAIIVAKANMDEFGLGLLGQGSLYGQTKNPYDLGRVPGGSSSGPAVAVTANFAAVGIGTDTCGSIRMPAAHNNLVGLRPTQGLLSRTGIVPLSHTQDTGAPIGRTVTDVAITLDAMVGQDPADPTTAVSAGHTPKSYAAALDGKALRGARIGLVTNLLGTDPEDAEVTAIIRKATADMTAQGAEVIEVSIEDIDNLTRNDRFRGFIVPAYEVKFALAKYFAALPDKPPASTIDEFLAAGPPRLPQFWLKNTQTIESLEVKEYTDAIARRAVLQQTLLATMANQRLDALAYPTYRRKPDRFEQKGVPQSNNCMIASVSGLPAISVPAGWTEDNLPSGIELLGKAWGEAELLKLAYAFEQATRHRRNPPTTPPLPAGGAPAPAAAPAPAGAR